MDPNANLQEMLRLAREVTRCLDEGIEWDNDDAARLAELVLALNGWLKGGGFLPSDWQR
jgi:hypothetical protein